MEEVREMAKGLGLGIAAVAAALLLAILCRDLFSPGTDALRRVEGLELIDSVTIADSSVTLKKTPNGEVYFQEYRKNWLLPRQEMTYICQIGEEPVQTAVFSPLAGYVVEADQEGITLLAEPETGLNWGQFCRVYGWLVLLFLYVPGLVYNAYKRQTKS